MSWKLAIKTSIVLLSVSEFNANEHVQGAQHTQTQTYTEFAAACNELT